MREKKHRSRSAKVPQVMQLEALECGAACLTMVLAYWKKWVPLEQIRRDCGVSRDGSNAANILKAARSYGMTAQGYRYEPEALRKEGSFPCIIHWRFNHFVVLCGFRGNKAYINDPAQGSYSVPMEVFDAAFTGIVLNIRPGEDFVPSGAPRSVLSFVVRRMKGLKLVLLFSILTTGIAAQLSVLTPIFDRIFYDRLLTGRSPEWKTPFLIALCMLYLVRVIVSLVTSAANLRINGKIHMVGNLSYMWKVLHLPMNFFSQRMTGDIVSRQNGNATVANTLVNVLSPILLNGAAMVFYLTVMLRYSCLLTFIGISFAALDMVFSHYVSKQRVNLSRVQARDNGALASATVSGIRMMDTLKSSGAEDGFFRKWAGSYAAVNASTQAFARKNAVWDMIPAVLSSLSGSLTLAVGLYFTMQGEFTLGSLTAFQGLCTSFLSPATQLIGAGQTIQEMRTQMERIDDVMEYPDDAAVKEEPLETDGEMRKLSGEVDIDDITFGYAPLSKPLISHFSMHIAPGSRVAFVGTSGCGKSTLSRLISGLYLPWSGSIRFDGKTVQEIDHSVFTGSLAVVDQEITLFEDTIAGNIKLGDESIEDYEMILAAKDAQLHYDIMARPGGYQYKLTEGGRDLSGGQRQRLEIARVLAQDPRIIILDEATSALDAKTEYEVVKAIKDRGITCIVIAHRLSTIRDCDQIVVLDAGHVVEQGTHEELVRKNGRYAQLVSNE